jgi:hypothetical protein
MRRRRYRRRSVTNWSAHHAAERTRVSALYGGIDAEVRHVFFNLLPDTLVHVLADYERQYGKAACDYARRAYGNWKSGKVQMSGQVSERLLAIVPRYLDFSVKYDLLEKLCRRRDATRLRVAITGDMTATEAIGATLRAIENVRSTGLPEHIAQRLHWLADNDGQVAKSLLGQVLAREYELVVRSVQRELLLLLTLSAELGGTSVEMQAQREVALPGVTVQIVLSSSSRTPARRKNTVPDAPANEESQNREPPGGALVPATNSAQGGQLAPIQNPQNLLEEALKRMPAEKQAEVLGKAADEALRLQVKRAEHELDQGMVSDKIDQAGRVAREATENPKVTVNFESEHRSEQGDTRIKVASKPSPFGCLSVLLVGVAVLVLIAWVV